MQDHFRFWVHVVFLILSIPLSLAASQEAHAETPQDESTHCFKDLRKIITLARNNEKYKYSEAEYLVRSYLERSLDPSSEILLLKEKRLSQYQETEILARFQTIAPPRSLTPDELDILFELKSKIASEIALNYNSEKLSHLNIYSPSEATPVLAFKALIESIQAHDQEAFVHATSEFGSLFDKEHSSEMVRLVDTFSTLFVTKSFPSEEERSHYLQIILQCGTFF